LPEPGVGENDSFLSHDEVQTFFHEMGHVLHHVLTKVDVMGVSGINGVEWDAVELPSQFMENFCWDWGVIQKISCDPVTGDSMPRSLFDKLLKAKNFMSGIQTLRQLEFSLFDFEIHSKCDDSLDVQRTLADVRRQTSVIAAPEYNRFAHSFSHIFGGGYAAGYYSYKWAEVLSADAFEAFQEEPEKIPELGKRFLREILSMGGARSALENFIAFRKRPPKIDALLRQSGLTGIQVVR
jgi:oligopeptidase A